MLRPLSADLQSWHHHPLHQRWQQWQTLQTLWTTVVGSQVSQHTQPLRTHNATLYVATSSAAWAQNLRLQRRLILEKLNPLLPQPLRDIHFSTSHWLSSEARELSQELGNSGHAFIAPPPQPPAAAPPPTPQAAFQRWAHKIKTLQTASYHPCPCCHTPTPNQELQRWGHCCFCHYLQPH